MEITRVVYGYSTMAESWIVPGGDDNIRQPIDFAFFLIRTPEQTVLVDAGCDTMSGFLMEDFIGPVEGLRRLGVSPEEITHILITHAHHDHMAGIVHFPNATICVQQDELERGRKYLCHTHTVISFADTLSPLPGIRMVRISGHSIGSCVVEVGDTVLCGDECYSRTNLTLRIPTAKSRDPMRSQYFLKQYADRNCLLCHQP